jgi:hypothetical protein
MYYKMIGATVMEILKNEFSEVLEKIKSRKEE